MPGRINNRHNGRLFCGVPARFDGPRGPVRGSCRNLSVGGLFFLGGTAPVGRSVELQIELPDGPPIRATGEVRYHHDYGSEGQGMGIRFVRIGAEDLVRVSRWVETHA